MIVVNTISDADATPLVMLFSYRSTMEEIIPAKAYVKMMRAEEQGDETSLLAT